MEDNSENYKDMMNLPHPTSRTHPRMSVSDRAAQFAPFAALTGFESAIKETARLTDKKIELDEMEKLCMDRVLKEIQEKIFDHPVIEITYFKSDETKKGGSYSSICGAVKKICEYEKKMIMEDGTEIKIEDIIKLFIIK